MRITQDPAAIIAALCCSFLLSCSMRPEIPIAEDLPAERLVREEAAHIIQVSEDRAALSRYRIYLSDFPRQDILGLSVGKRTIYISHRLARLAAKHIWHRWLLRQTLAHEIAHETAGHARSNSRMFFTGATSGRSVTQEDIGLPSNIAFRNYSYESELEADSRGLDYWRRLNWNCAIWIRILESFTEHRYIGDVLHPTAERLKQAKRECRPAPDTDGTAIIPFSRPVNASSAESFSK